MTDSEKLSALKVLLGGGDDVPDDEYLTIFLMMAESEIMHWRYHLVGGAPSGATMPDRFANTQIHAVIAGYTQAGAEGQSVHIENGIHRHFRYEDMLGYIHDHVLPYVRVGAVNADTSEE